MPTLPLLPKLDTIRRAYEYLGSTKRVPFVSIEAIMQLHILEVPELRHLAGNFHQRKWSLLASQLMSLAAERSKKLVDQIADDRDTGREALRTEAHRIRLMYELAQAVNDIGLGAPELGN